MRRGSVFVGLAALLFAFNGVVSKIVLTAGMDPIRLTELRATAGFVCLLLLNMADKDSPMWPRASEIPLLVAYGISEVFVVQVFYFYAIRSLPLGIAVLIEYLAPVLVAVWARVKSRETSRLGVWAGLLLGVVGLALVGQVWKRFQLDLFGVCCALIAALALACSFVVGEMAAKRRKSINVTVWALGTGAVVCAVVRPWWSFRPGIMSVVTHGFPIWLLCIDIIGVGTIAPYLLLIEGLRRVSATRVGVLMTLEPAAAIWFAWVLLDERLSAIQVAGGLLIMAGVVSAELARRSGPTASSDEDALG